MEGAKADIIYTDPPYGVSYKGTNFDIIKNDKLRDSALLTFLTKAFTNGYNHTKDNPAVYCFYASKTHIEFEQALIFSGFEVKQQLIWQKGFNLGRSDYHWSHEPMLYAIKKGNNSKWYGDRTQQTTLTKQLKEYDKLKKSELVEILEALHDGQTVWQIKKDASSTYQHPTQKPVELAVRALENSTKRGHKVLDLFTGSGSTMIACEKFGRQFYGMEFDPIYADVIKNRWQTFTGKKAIKK
jgi:DNA modification methylase